MVGVEFQGEVEFYRQLRKIPDAAKDLTPVWPDVVKVLQEEEAAAFASEGATTRRGKWKSLSPAYAARKAKKTPGKTILMATGRLQASVTAKTEDSVIEETPTSLTFGTTVKYAKFHQRGTRRMPQREFLSLTDRGINRITRRIRKHLVANAD